MVWGLIPGKYETGNEKSAIAIATLNSDFNFKKDLVAIWGKIATENLGVTTVLSNILSNPSIRYLIVCGEEVRGHFPGEALVSFYNEGYQINSSGRISIKNTHLADPTLPIEESTMGEVYTRFKEQITLVDLIGETDINKIGNVIDNCLSKDIPPMSSPYTISLKKKDGIVSLEDEIAIHAKVRLNNMLICQR